MQQLVLSALIGAPSRSLSPLQIQEKLAELGVKSSKQSIALMLFDLQENIEGSSWFPFQLLEGAGKWYLQERCPEIEPLITGRKLRLITPLRQETLEVLAAVTLSGGVSSSRLSKTFARNTDDDVLVLLTEALIYQDPRVSHSCYRPAPAMLRRFGLKSLEDIPGYNEYRKFILGKSKQLPAFKESSPTLKKSKRSRLKKLAD